MNHTRDILQTFWRDEQLPWLELRSTRQSRQAYKRHRHSQLSVGAIIEGETCCLCNGREYLLRPGDLIIIPAQRRTAVTRAMAGRAATICCTSI